MQILIQLIALLALAGFAGSFHAKTRRGILFWQLISLATWVIHFSLLGAFAGVIMTSVNGALTIPFLYKDRVVWLRNPMVLYVGMALCIVAGIICWTGFPTIFAILGVIAATIAKWQNNTNRIRRILILAGILWIIYDIFAGSWGGVITETVIIISALVSLLRGQTTKK